MKPLQEVPYVQDILSQSEALNSALVKFDASTLEPMKKALQRGDFDRILLTGMGASLYAAYPTWLALVQAGLPAMWVDTAELIHHARELVTPRTLYWLFSQSGHSAEIVSALDFGRMPRPGALLATVNDLESPLAKAALEFNEISTCIPINAIVEKTVSTRTYINGLAVSRLAAESLAGREVPLALDALRNTAESMKTYLDNWEAHVQRMGELLGYPKRLAILGRGSSLAATYTGALILGEAAKYSAIPYQAGEFRHGPLELAGPDLTVLVFAGPPETRELNARLLRELRGYQTPAFWVGAEAQEWQIEIPEIPAIGLPLVEILPIQLLSIHLAEQIGVEPGHFFRSGKVTVAE